MANSELIAQLNLALAWELRASVMYAHYAAYVAGIHRLHLQPYFEAESAESQVHAQVVRTAIVKLGGIAVTNRDATDVKHVTNYREILGECLATEKKAAQTYESILGLIEDDELYDALQQIFFAEARAVEDLVRLMD